MRSPGAIHCCLSMLAAAAMAIVPLAGQTAAEHKEHHPAAPAGQIGPPKSVPPVGPMSQPPPPKALYPSLIDLPVLTPERRAELDRFAGDRMVTGTKLMSDGLQKLNGAARTKDYAAMQQATDQMREGLAQFDSGLAARRALVEGRAPRDVALEWFKREMNLQPAAATDTSTAPLFKLAWYHYAVMVALTLFALSMIWMHFHRMRRAEALLTALASGARVPPSRSGPAEPTSAPSVASSPASPVANAGDVQK